MTVAAADRTTLRPTATPPSRCSGAVCRPVIYGAPLASLTGRGCSGRPLRCGSALRLAQSPWPVVAGSRRAHMTPLLPQFSTPGCAPMRVWQWIRESSLIHVRVNLDSLSLASKHGRACVTNLFKPPAYSGLVRRSLHLPPFPVRVGLRRHSSGSIRIPSQLEWLPMESGGLACRLQQSESDSHALRHRAGAGPRGRLHDLNVRLSLTSRLAGLVRHQSHRDSHSSTSEPHACFCRGPPI